MSGSMDQHYADALAALAELDRDCATAKSEGIRAAFDYLLTYAANNYHPNHQETCDKENAVIERVAETMLDCLSPEWSAKWKEVSQLCVRIAELERERDELRAGLERLARLYEDEHDLCERPMWLQELIARPTRKGE